MKKLLLTGLFMAGFTVMALPTPVAAACIIDGQYYENSHPRCIDLRSRATIYGYTPDQIPPHHPPSTHTNYQYGGGYGGGQNIAAMQQYIQQLLLILEQLQAAQGGHGTYNPYPPATGNSDVDVRTRSARGVDDDRATLRGEVDFNNEDEATVYFQYGRSRNNLNYDTTHIVLDEDDDDEDFSQRIIDLRDDTNYYFRAVAEDERGRRDYGSILDFDTDDDGRNSNDDEPRAYTGEADDIEDDRAEINGEVDMNDFDDGKVFFVWGEDEDLVEEIEDEYDEYDDIDEEGDDLQKHLVDSSFDGNNGNFWLNIGGLDDDTDYFYSICVEYEDDDDDEVIVCGGVEEFTTDD